MIPIEQLNIDIKKDNIIEGIMKSNGLYCLVAEPKVGKSFLALLSFAVTCFSNVTSSLLT